MAQWAIAINGRDDRSQDREDHLYRAFGPIFEKASQSAPEGGHHHGTGCDHDH